MIILHFDGLILKGDRVVVPESLRAQVLEATHTGHQGETKCLLLARQSVVWPGISGDIRYYYYVKRIRSNSNVFCAIEIIKLCYVMLC